MKKQIIILIILIVLAVLSEFLWKYGQDKMPAIDPVYSYEQNTTLIDVATASDYAVVSGSYPVFKNADPAFNANIADFVQSAIKDQFENSAENYKARVDTALPSENIPAVPAATDRFPMSIKTTIARNDARIISVVIHIDQYTGGAHGQEIIQTFNYDLDAKTQITVQSLLQKYPDFLEKVSTLARAELRLKLAEDAQVSQNEINTEMLNDGTSPIAENFSLFSFPDDTHITLYFTQYQVAPYVFGSPKITLLFPLQ